ncbi:hypothetical protein [Caldimonas aquatica]|uniref:VIT family protein n=1 Tax=Caldimonas aquatica TaxID=376175 RepID=A0ABY6MWH7_9BURK|nr:hypothetical protein [Schlegelella aquatica]UZD56358.1 hypothetical protein OMP39_07295 [Schlegelella aquatica]
MSEPPLSMPVSPSAAAPGAAPGRPRTAADRATEAVVGVLLSMVFVGLIALTGAGRGALLVAALSASAAWGGVCAVLCRRGLSLLGLWRRRWIARLAQADSGQEMRRALAQALPASVAEAVEAEDVARLQALAAQQGRHAERADHLQVLMAALAAMLAPLPLWWPFVMVADTALALRLVHGTAAVWLFLLGAWAARRAGVSPWLAAGGLALLAGMLGTMHAWLRG